MPLLSPTQALVADYTGVDLSGNKQLDRYEANFFKTVAQAQGSGADDIDIADLEKALLGVDEDE